MCNFQQCPTNGVPHVYDPQEFLFLFDSSHPGYLAVTSRNPPIPNASQVYYYSLAQRNDRRIFAIRKSGNAIQCGTMDKTNMVNKIKWPGDTESFSFIGINETKFSGLGIGDIIDMANRILYFFFDSDEGYPVGFEYVVGTGLFIYGCQDGQLVVRPREDSNVNC